MKNCNTISEVNNKTLARKIIFKSYDSLFDMCVKLNMDNKNLLIHYEIATVCWDDEDDSTINLSDEINKITWI